MEIPIESVRFSKVLKGFCRNVRKTRCNVGLRQAAALPAYLGAVGVHAERVEALVDVDVAGDEEIHAVPAAKAGRALGDL